MTTMFDEYIRKLKIILNENAAKKHMSDENIHFNKVVYYQLIDIRNAIEYAVEKQFSNDNLSILEDICMGININLTLNHSLQSMILTIYHDIIIKSPGYVVRNVLNSMITVCNHKICANIAKDTAIQVISSIMLYKPSDCGNQINDVLQIIVKLMKLNDVKLRASSVKTLISILKGSQHKIEDLHSEILKHSLKYATDKVVEVRLLIAETLKYIALYSANGGKATTAITVEALLTPSLKGLEDEATVVQDMYCQVVATIFMEQIQQHIEALEQSKVGAARGSGNSSTEPGGGGDSPMKVSTAIRGAISKRISLSSLTISLSSKKGIVDIWDFKSVIVYLHKQILGTMGLLRVSYIRTLGYLTASLLEVCSTEDFEWLLASNLEMLSSPVLQGLTYEEMVYFRCRFSHLIRCSITSIITEPQLILYANQLIKHISTIDATSTMSDLELHFIISELHQLVIILGPASVSFVADILMLSPLYLKHSSFTVRATTAQLLASTSAITPIIAIEILQTNLLSLRLQVKELLALDVSEDENLEVDLDPEHVGDIDQSVNTTNITTMHPEEQYSTENGSNHHSGTTTTGLSTTTSTTIVSNHYPGGSGVMVLSHGKKSLKDLERLHHMYVFHGHTLVISTILKHAHQLPTGLPISLITEIYDFGLEMFSFNVMNSPLHFRSISCSIVRAGSLIVSSCCSMGYMIAKVKLPELLNCLKSVFDCYCQSNNTTTTIVAATTVRSQDLVYEVMCVEAALVCISTLLLFCSESLTLESQCLHVLVEGLESTFRTLKSKYQSRLKSHFRLKTLYVILLECFSWLPPGCYPLTSQGVFVEALRVFRDSVSLGLECTCLHDFLATEFSILKHGAGQSSMIATTNTVVPLYTLEAPMSENMLMLKLESHSIALQKKESEAFLSIFSKDHENGLTFNDLFSSISSDIGSAFIPINSTPCAHLDTRTFDAALLLIAATFTHQSNDYQDKAIQLCVQALAQFTKPEVKSTLSLFSSDEEKKKKDRKNFITQCSVLAFISAVIRTYPTVGIVNDSTSTTSSQDDSSSSGSNSIGTGTWMRCVVDMLYTMLNHSSYIIRSGSAYSLSLFAMKIHKHKITEESCFKIRSTIINSLMLLDKKAGDVSVVGDYSGYLIALASFWKGSQHLNDVKSVILTTIFDCLRKVTSPLQFRAHGLLALSTIVNDYLAIVNNKYHYKLDNDLNYMTLMNTESLDLLDKVATVLEAQLSNIAIVPLAGGLLSYIDTNMELFEVCLLRLANISTALSLQLSKDSTHPDVANALHIRFYSICTLYRNNPFNHSTSSSLLIESLKLIPLMTPIDNDGIYTRLFLEWFKRIVCNRKDYSFEALLNVLEGVELLLVKYPVQACELGIGGSLFVLLDYFFSLMNFSSPNCYAGIEIKRGMMEQIGNHGFTSNRALMLCLSKCINIIYNFVSADVKQSIDCRSVYWILFCRAIVLNLHSSSSVTNNKATTNTTVTSGDSNTNSARDNNVVGAVADEDDDPFDEDQQKNSSSSSSTTKENVNISMNLISFITYCRDEVLTFVPDLDFCRVQVKCVAMQCIYLALSFIPKNNSIHTDLGLARIKTKEALQQSKNDYNNASKLSTIPKYVVLFLTDLINISCLCVTFMIDDKPILRLQSESMHLLHHIVSLFQDSIDPDHKMTTARHVSVISTTNTTTTSSTYCAEEMIIHQFISQITSAIRICLTSSKDHRTMSSDLVYSSGMLLYTLLSRGLVSDKMVLKRLLKLLLEYFDSDDINETTTSLQLPIKYRELMSIEYASAIHISYVSIVAVIYTLVYNDNTYETTKNHCVTNDIRATVVACFEPYLGLIKKLTLALTIDTIRFEHFQQSQGNSLWLVHTASSLPIGNEPQQVFPNTIHPYRGGYIYQMNHSCVQMMLLKKNNVLNHLLQTQLTHMFPLNLYNYLSLLSSSNTELVENNVTTNDQIDLFLNIIHQSLMSIYIMIDCYHNNKQNTTIISELNVSTNEYINKYSIEEIIEQKHTLIACFIPMAHLQLRMSLNNDILIDTSQWRSILSYLTLKELLNKSTTTSLSEQSICMILEIIPILSNISKGLNNNELHIQQQQQQQQQQSSLSIHMIIMITIKSFQCIFNEQDVVKYMEHLTHNSITLSSSPVDIELPPVQTSLTNLLVTNNNNNKNSNSIDVISNVKLLNKLESYTLLITNLTNIALQNDSLSAYILQLLLQILVLLNINKQYDHIIVTNTSYGIITSYLSISKQLITTNTDYTSLLLMHILQYMYQLYQIEDFKISDEAIKTITLLLFDIWNKLHLVNNVGENPKLINTLPPFQWNTLILHLKIDSKVLLFLEIILTYLPNLVNTEYGLDTIQSLLPSLLIRFNDMIKDNVINIRIKILILKIFIYLFDFIPNIDKKQIFLDLILVPICINITYYERITKNHEIILACGYLITHIVRIIPDVFKQVILTLSDTYRITLQQTMVLTIQQQQLQQQQPNINNNNKNNNQLKTSDKMQINMDKYRK